MSTIAESSIDDFFKNNVLPFNKLALMDRSKDKIGFEIPFGKLFYKFNEPRKSEEIFSELTEMTAIENKLMEELFGGK